MCRTGPEVPKHLASSYMQADSCRMPWFGPIWSVSSWILTNFDLLLLKASTCRWNKQNSCNARLQPFWETLAWSGGIIHWGCRCGFPLALLSDKLEITGGFLHSKFPMPQASAVTWKKLSPSFLAQEHNYSPTVWKTCQLFVLCVKFAQAFGPAATSGIRKLIACPETTPTCGDSQWLYPEGLWLFAEECRRRSSLRIFIQLVAFVTTWEARAFVELVAARMGR